MADQAVKLWANVKYLSEAKSMINAGHSVSRKLMKKKNSLGQIDFETPLCIIVNSCYFKENDREYECAQIVEYLLKNGADVNEYNACGKTALHIASMRHMGQVVKLLLSSGADVNACHRGDIVYRHQYYFELAGQPLHDVCLTAEYSPVLCQLIMSILLGNGADRNGLAESPEKLFNHVTGFSELMCLITPLHVLCAHWWWRWNRNRLACLEAFLCHKGIHINQRVGAVCASVTKDISCMDRPTAVDMIVVAIQNGIIVQQQRDLRDSTFYGRSKWCGRQLDCIEIGVCALGALVEHGADLTLPYNSHQYLENYWTTGIERISITGTGGYGAGLYDSYKSISENLNWIGSGTPLDSLLQFINWFTFLQKTLVKNWDSMHATCEKIAAGLVDIVVSFASRPGCRFHFTSESGVFVTPLDSLWCDLSYLWHMPAWHPDKRYTMPCSREDFVAALSDRLEPLKRAAPPLLRLQCLCARALDINSSETRELVRLHPDKQLIIDVLRHQVPLSRVEGLYHDLRYGAVVSGDLSGNLSGDLSGDQRGRASHSN